MRCSRAARELRTCLELPKEAKLITFVGRFINAKRPIDAVNAFQSIAPEARDTCLVFVGDGPLMEEITQVSRNDPRVMTLGWLKEPEVLASILAMSSMLVLPSQHEPWGAVVNEAMAAGTPVIASDQVGAAHELIAPGKTGFIHAVGDIHALASAITTLLNDEALRVQMGKLAQVTAVAQGHAFAATNLITGARHAVSNARA